MCIDYSELMRDCFVGIESLRRTSDVVANKVGSWVGASLSYRHHMSPEWCECQEKLWHALGKSSM